MGHLLIMHHEGKIKLCNTMVWFSNEDKLLNCLLLKKPHCDQEERVSNTNNQSSNPEGKKIWYKASIGLCSTRLFKQMLSHFTSNFVILILTHWRLVRGQSKFWLFCSFPQRGSEFNTKCSGKLSTLQGSTIRVTGMALISTMSCLLYSIADFSRYLHFFLLMPLI